jgi:phospholipid/cholesterol/gamma-HCH transport system substrate-binding protein
MSYVVVGAFTLAIIGGLVVAIALLTGRTGATQPYFTMLRSVPGIATGTLVLFQGYRVGRIASVEPLVTAAGHRFRVELEVDRRLNVPDDSVAFLTTGLLSAVNVNIDGGSSSVFLVPGGEIRSREPTDIFSTLTDVAGDANDLVKDLDGILERNVAPLIDSAGRQMQALSDRLAALLSPDNVEGMQRIVANLDRTTGDVARLVGELHTTRVAVDGLLGKIDALVENNQEHLDHTVSDLQYSVESVARHIDTVTRNLEATTRNMNDFSREIRANPALLLRGGPPADDGEGARP